MGNFGEAVASLLETYSKCLSLLKGLRQGGKPSDDQSRLRASIRSDRSQVRQAYSSSLRRRGASFEKGDATARSSLRRVVRRLTSTLAELMRTLTRQPVDYDSLMSLSNASRLDALRTMSDLSSRVGSQTSLRSTRSRGTSRTSRSSGRKRHSKHREKRSVERQGDMTDRPRSTHSGSASGDQAGRSKRASMATMSSGSTKLGEIRVLRKPGPYENRVTYPLHLHSDVAGLNDGGARKKKRWFGIFGSR